MNVHLLAIWMHRHTQLGHKDYDLLLFVVIMMKARFDFSWTSSLAFLLFNSSSNAPEFGDTVQFFFHALMAVWRIAACTHDRLSNYFFRQTPISRKSDSPFTVKASSEATKKQGRGRERIPSWWSIFTI